MLIVFTVSSWLEHGQCNLLMQVYSWWKSSRPWMPYPCTLYVTVKAIAIPCGVDPAMRSMHAVQQVNCLLSAESLSDCCLSFCVWHDSLILTDISRHWRGEYANKFAVKKLCINLDEILLIDRPWAN